MGDKKKPGPPRSLLPPVPDVRLTMPTGKGRSLSEAPGFFTRRLALAPFGLPREGILRVRATSGEPPPGYTLMPSVLAQRWLEVIDEIKRAQRVPAPPPEPGRVRKVLVQWVPGALGVFHVPLAQKPSAFQDLNLAGAVQLVLQMHDDDGPGWETAFSLQGSWTLWLNDPDQAGRPVAPAPNAATQLQAAVQLTYAFNQLKNTKLQPQLFGQLSVAWGRSYDAAEHRWVGSNQANLGIGAGLNYEIDKKTTAGLAATAGPTFVGDGVILLDLGTQITWAVTFD